MCRDPGLIRVKSVVRVPNLATFEFEIRNIADEDPSALMKRIRDAAERIEKEAREIFASAELAREGWEWKL